MTTTTLKAALEYSVLNTFRNGINKPCPENVKSRIIRLLAKYKQFEKAWEVVESFPTESGVRWGGAFFVVFYELLYQETKSVANTHYSRFSSLDKKILNDNHFLSAQQPEYNLAAGIILGSTGAEEKAKAYFENSWNNASMVFGDTATHLIPVARCMASIYDELHAFGYKEWVIEKLFDTIRSFNQAPFPYVSGTQYLEAQGILLAELMKLGDKPEATRELFAEILEKLSDYKRRSPLVATTSLAFIASELASIRKLDPAETFFEIANLWFYDCKESAAWDKTFFNTYSWVFHSYSALSSYYFGKEYESIDNIKLSQLVLSQWLNIMEGDDFDNEALFALIKASILTSSNEVARSALDLLIKNKGLIWLDRIEKYEVLTPLAETVSSDVIVSHLIPRLRQPQDDPILFWTRFTEIIPVLCYWDLLDLVIALTDQYILNRQGRIY